jgi:8-oxo-dGTP pyrophosphatase MutT (NUDIX family)
LVGELVARVTRNLVVREPPRKGSRFAAVSIIVRDRQVPSVLLIKRAERLGDPWSGQIAFPGGKMKSEDRTARDTAVRETMEEVGIDLNRSAEFLGYGGVATTHTGTMDVVPSVFVLKEEVEVRPNEEIASFRWVDLDDLMAPTARSTYDLSYDGRTVGTPAYAVGDYVVWGLTYRILSTMLESTD